MVFLEAISYLVLCVFWMVVLLAALVKVGSLFNKYVLGDKNEN